MGLVQVRTSCWAPFRSHLASMVLPAHYIHNHQGLMFISTAVDLIYTFCPGSCYSDVNNIYFNLIYGVENISWYCSLLIYVVTGTCQDCWNSLGSRHDLAFIYIGISTFDLRPRSTWNIPSNTCSHLRHLTNWWIK